MKLLSFSLIPSSKFPANSSHLLANLNQLDFIFPLHSHWCFLRRTENFFPTLLPHLKSFVGRKLWSWTFFFFSLASHFENHWLSRKMKTIKQGWWKMHEWERENKRKIELKKWLFHLSSERKEKNRLFSSIFSSLLILFSSSRSEAAVHTKKCCEADKEKNIPKMRKKSISKIFNFPITSFFSNCQKQ